MPRPCESIKRANERSKNTMEKATLYDLEVPQKVKEKVSSVRKLGANRD